MVLLEPQDPGKRLDRVIGLGPRQALGGDVDG
jgi:hypothetical protein